MSRKKAESPPAPRLGPGREFDLIREFVETGPPDRPDVRIGSGDDCAVITGTAIAVSTDMFVENVHFRRDWLKGEEIGYRATAAALSDLAAMAARPIGVLVSVAASAADVQAELVHEIGTGVRNAAADFGAALLGGDLSRAAELMLNITVLGDAPDPVARSGARAGDAIFVTGRLGAAAAAVRAWRRGWEPPEAARAAFARPRPRIREARWLAEHAGIHALIDLSDGLTGDLSHLAAASGKAVGLDVDRVPVHPAAREVTKTDANADAVRLALGGGEDYELCFAAPARPVEEVMDAFHDEFGIRLSRVGTVREGSGVHVVENDGTWTPIHDGGYTHFKEDST